jgi:hypothetical protein
MSTTDSHFTGRTYDRRNFYPLTMLSLNELFKESMRKVLIGRSELNIITRCENLPSVRGNKEDFLVLFEELIRMIITGTTNSSKLFLFVDCEEVKENQPDHLTKDFNTYTIKFRTNISPNQDWEADQAMTLAKCREFVSAHSGIFLVNSSNHTGCIFSITLPGKY